MNATTNQYCIKCHKYWGSESRKWYCSVCFKEEEKNLKLKEEEKPKEEKPKENEKMDIDSELPVVLKPVQVKF
jgi:hypothetical protein